MGAKRQDNHHGDSSETQGLCEKDTLTLCVCVRLRWCVPVECYLPLFVLTTYSIFPDFRGINEHFGQMHVLSFRPSDEKIDTTFCTQNTKLQPGYS